jgi:DnaJ-class molecular chaperone
MVGKGPQRYKDLPPGNLIVRLHVDIPEDWGTDGVDIFYRQNVNVLDALTGTELDFTFIDNRKIKLTIPKGIQNGQKLRVRNYGMQDPSRGLIGNLYIICNLIVPDNLSEDALKLVNKIKEQNGL